MVRNSITLPYAVRGEEFFTITTKGPKGGTTSYAPIGREAAIKLRNALDAALKPINTGRGAAVEETP